MAAIPVQTSDEAGLLISGGMTATAAGGDTVACANDGSDYVFVFRNDHSAGVDVVMTGQASGVSVPGYGKMSKANVTKTVAANGGLCIFTIPAKDLGPWLDSSGRVAFTYASHNVALKMLPIKVKP